MAMHSLDYGMTLRDHALKSGRLHFKGHTIKRGVSLHHGRQSVEQSMHCWVTRGRQGGHYILQTLQQQEGRVGPGFYITVYII